MSNNFKSIKTENQEEKWAQKKPTKL